MRKLDIGYDLERMIMSDGWRASRHSTLAHIRSELNSVFHVVWSELNSVFHVVGLPGWNLQQHWKACCQEEPSGF